jgi:hypothetical protein
MTHRRMNLALALLLTAACAGDEDGASGTNADTTSTGGGSSSGTNTTPGTASNTTADSTADTTASDTATTDVPGTTTDEPGTTTDGPGTTTDEPGTTTGDPGTSSGDSGTTGAADVCAPEVTEDECAMCVKDSCCAELEACQTDAGCVCFQDCAAMNPGLGGAIGCAGDCNISLLDLMNPDTISGALAVCSQNGCPVCLQ